MGTRCGFGIRLQMEEDMINNAEQTVTERDDGSLFFRSGGLGGNR
jgi:hypothetical protein